MTAEDIVTAGIVGIIFVTLLVLLRSKAEFKYSHGPELVTTIGILGTFLGVSIAIYTLATSEDIISSLPSFISSLKLAFIASTTGVLSAVILRLFHLFDGKVKKQEDVTSKLVDSGGSQSSELLLKELRLLNKSIAGAEDGTLLSQVKLLRNDMNDELAGLRKSFNEFATHMVENNQKAFIEALNAAIRDFNQNLTEQFGENFKQLNLSVEKLVLWQLQYKEQLERLIVIEEKTAESMNAASNSYTELVKSASEFKRTAEELATILPSMKTTTDAMLVLSQSLAEVLGSMKEVAPQFSTKVDAMIVQLDAGITGLISAVSKTIESLVSQSMRQMNDGYQNIVASHEDSIKNFSSLLQNSTSELKELLTATIKDNQKLLHSNLEDSLAKIKEAVAVLDKGLEKELNRSLESLSHQLASLSAKFVDDYAPLTERLKEVLKIAESVKR